MKRALFAVCAMLAAVNLLAGCATVGEGPMQAVRVDIPGNSQGMIRMNSVAILDRDLQQWVVHQDSSRENAKSGKIALESTGARRSQTGTVEAWALLRNRTNKALNIEARVQFFDTAQTPLEGPTAWERLFMAPNSIATYKEFSTGIQNVSYYYIEVREAH